MTVLRSAFFAAAAFGAVLVGGLGAPALAAPLLAPAGFKAAGAASDPTVQVRSDRKKRRAQAPRSPGPGLYVPPYGTQSTDTVGSLGADAQGRTVNRFTGQIYQICMLDEGYGRVRPCDAGGGGGGGGSFN